MKITRKDLIIGLIQAMGWFAFCLIPPFIDFFVRNDWMKAWELFKVNGGFTLPLAILYFLNFYGLIPYLFYKSHRTVFLLVNVVLIAYFVCRVFVPFPTVPSEWESGVYIAIFSLFFANVLVVSCAVGVRYMLRWNDMQMRLKEEKQKNAEAELAWLKNQLNPHFLFNTLNNISSLVQIDQDTAQESIGQLSDLLRYTLYESNHELVPVEGEIEFMSNYIELMRLRCNELATVEVDLQVPPKPMRIVPLLFISLIENAFKHGVNSRKPSFVRIRFKAEGDDLVFTCENTDHPKPDVNRSGSGIGLENLRRRLDLAYPGRYRYDQELRETIYFVQITLQDCL
ncbi:MAG: histidine kinase [Parabacteroides sp.]|nr:histidine kinase [Parabacteroides sp.]